MPSSREIIINSVKTWLNFATVPRAGSALVSKLDVTRTLDPQFHPEQSVGVVPFRTVVLDPGHGGYDLGAMSRFGCEKDYALEIARRIKPYLEDFGLNVVMTRTGDEFVPLEKRGAIANANGDAIFVSLHFNATDGNPRAAGFEVFSIPMDGAPASDEEATAKVPGKGSSSSTLDIPSLILATCVQHSLLGHLRDYDRGVKRARYAVLREARIPAVLIECGFLSDASESKSIADVPWRRQLAHAVAMGIYNYQNLVQYKRAPLRAADFRRLNGGSDSPPVSGN